MQVINASAEGWMREGALGPWSGRGGDGDGSAAASSQRLRELTLTKIL